MQTTETAPIRLESEKSVIERTGLCRTSIYVLVEQGRFPQPIYLSPRKKSYLVAEVDEFLAARIRERETARALAKEAAKGVTRSRLERAEAA